MSIDLKGNTNYAALKNLDGQYIPIRTNLSAVDMIVANGLEVQGDTLSLKQATATDIQYGTSGSVVTPDVLKPILDSKQDTLTQGAGINITNSTISTADVPISAVTGLDTALAAKQDTLSAGYRMAIISGSTVDQLRYFPIVSATSATVVLEAGSAYKIQAVTGSKTLDSENVPENQFGLEGHAEIFIAGSGMIKTTSNVVLATPLEPDAVNNCTVRFHDGRAIISVEDHIAGHVVTSGGSGTNSLKYWLETANTSDAATQYISVDASLDHTTLDFASAAVNGEKHLVGNGYEATVVSGSVNCGTNKFTVSNLGLQDVTVAGGTLTMGDAYIPSGSTVAVSGGGLAVEKVSVDGELKGGLSWARYSTAKISGSGTLNLDGSYMPTNGDYDFNLNCSGVSIVNGSGGAYGATILARNRNTFNLTSCTISNNTAYWGAVKVNSGGTLNLSSCSFSSNAATYRGKDTCFDLGAKVTITGCTFGNGGGTAETANVSVIANPSSCTVTDCTFGSGVNIGFSTSASSASVTLSGTNKFLGKVATIGTATGQFLISSGAILDLTENTNTTPIAPAGGVTFGAGGATVYPSAGQASAYTLNGMKVPNIGNTNVVNLSGGRVTGITSDAYASNCIFSGGTAAFVLGNSSQGLTLDKCTVTGNAAAGTSGGFWLEDGTRLNLSSSIVSGNGTYDIFGYGDVEVSASTVGVVNMSSKGSLKIAGETKAASTISGGVQVTISSGAVLDLTGNTNPTPIAPGGGITFEAGGATVLYSSGAVSGSYSMDNVVLSSGAKLTNTNVIDLGSTYIGCKQSATAIISGAVVTHGNNTTVGGGI